METGICVKVTRKLDNSGNTVCAAVHKRDSTTTYRLRMQTRDPEEVLKAWVAKFTGKHIGRLGLTADYKVAARAGDHEGYYYTLVPTNYN